MGEIYIDSVSNGSGDVYIFFTNENQPQANSGVWFPEKGINVSHPQGNDEYTSKVVIGIVEGKSAIKGEYFNGTQMISGIVAELRGRGYIVVEEEDMSSAEKTDEP